VITVRNAEYVIANVVRKTATGRVIAHFVNYGPPAENVNVRLNLRGVAKQIDATRVRLLSPDDVSRQLKDVSVRGTELTFTIPRIDVYDVIVMN
jgi:hypothetical protein